MILNTSVDVPEVPLLIMKVSCDKLLGRMGWRLLGVVLYNSRGSRLSIYIQKFQLDSASADIDEEAISQ